MYSEYPWYQSSAASSNCIFRRPKHRLSRQLCLQLALLSRLRSTRLLLWQRRKAQIWLDDLQIWPDILRIFGFDGRVHDHIVARDPVDRGCHLILVTRLERIDDAEDFSSIAAGRGWVREDETDGLLGVDDEDGADREGLAEEESVALRHCIQTVKTYDALGVDIGRILVVKPGSSRQLPLPTSNSTKGRAHVV